VGKGVERGAATVREKVTDMGRGADLRGSQPLWEGLKKQWGAQIRGGGQKMYMTGRGQKRVKTNVKQWREGGKGKEDVQCSEHVEKKLIKKEPWGSKGQTARKKKCVFSNEREPGENKKNIVRSRLGTGEGKSHVR